ncbi:Pycsar system effector family protein [Streptomyces sp. NBC_00696]|uniref:Pycsar system effector family protein n=1 Tax=Streptomyces sp. NBC_00696 TaxID=2903672 RepID=UPI002E30821F|nr:Pycsar system effector family protein [Streptomyces sp. NBC_00696]
MQDSANLRASARTDSKASLLLAFVGALLAGAWTVAKDVPLTTPADVAGGAGMGLLVTAAGLLLRSVRPNLGGGRGFPLWATLRAEEISATLAQDQAADIAGLSRIAVAKFTCLQRAGGGLLILAALLAAGGAA